VPRTMAELRPLPGVGRKTANVILGNAYDTSEGITVDTHVLRLSALLKLVRGTAAEPVEIELMKLVPREDWAVFSHLLIWHGRRICIANRPRCSECVLNDICPSAFRVPGHV
jgi:endonuclease-3